MSKRITKRKNINSSSNNSLHNKQTILKKLKVSKPQIDELLQNLKIEDDNISFNEFYENRINKYNIITSNDIKLSNECLITSNNIIKLNTTQQNIILREIIGSGATSYIFSADANYDNDKKIDIIFKILSLGENEINIMNKISNFVINQTTPHFIINYISNYRCNKIHENNDDSQINKHIKIINSYAKDYTNNNYSLIAMEKLDKDIQSLIGIIKDENILINIYAQMYIALLTFHLYLESIHDDVQYKNFFYKKINNSDNEYFYYKFTFSNKETKNIYIKNIGYLIILADYGFSRKIHYNQYIEYINKEYITRQKKEKIYLDDYSMIIDKNNHNLLKNSIDNKNTEEIFFKELIRNNNSFIKELPDNSILLNKKPYILDFIKRKIHSI